MTNRSLNPSAAVMACALVLGTTSLALAGADDSKTKAFFLPGVGTMSGPGSSAQPAAGSDDMARTNRERSVATYRGTVPDASGRTARIRKAHHAVRHDADGE